MGMKGKSRVHFGQRSQCNSYGAHGNAKKRVRKEGISKLRLCIDNSSVVHVTNAFVASSGPIVVREIRRFNKVLDKLGLQLSSEWIPSTANKFADALSRCVSPGDLAVRQTLRRFVVDGMMEPLDSFPLRPLGELPSSCAAIATTNWYRIGPSRKRDCSVRRWNSWQRW
jgi:hypothetical protein